MAHYYSYLNINRNFYYQNCNRIPNGKGNGKLIELKEAQQEKCCSS